MTAVRDIRYEIQDIERTLDSFVEEVGEKVQNGHTIDIVRCSEALAQITRRIAALDGQAVGAHVTSLEQRAQSIARFIQKQQLGSYTGDSCN